VKSLSCTRFYTFQNPTPDLLLCLSSKTQQKSKRRGIKASKLFSYLHTVGFTWLEIFLPEKLDWRTVGLRSAPKLEEDQAISLGPAVGWDGRQDRGSHRSLPCHSSLLPPPARAGTCSWSTGKKLTQARASASTNYRELHYTHCCNSAF